ncbi:pantothenate kinase [Leptolyngbya sp. FACHB-261]|uniref:pantothenate kinase n=1 Tax=Leptolyngbya sp. FACHB-261 TaxID=2692806 RepID=UPI001687AE0E|nr:pantothenate kinase [Leptolyngbya sp. FACHB-261]MBD2101564.1 pantothenate kinase [Leptolyngbya sp. FACHB-261]
MNGSQPISATPETWTALVIGNTHQHCGQFSENDLQQVEHLPHQALIRPAGPLWLASVVPQATEHWQQQREAGLDLKLLDLSTVPLNNLYPSFGIDRALALLGAGELLGWPVLVIDAGTALTLTGANRERALVGGAILPGLGLQLKSLQAHTAALPTVPLTESLPSRWALDTPAAMQSGVIYTVLAGIRDFLDDWQRLFPESQVVVTGGDGPLLAQHLGLRLDPDLVFWGIRAARRSVLAQQ